MIKTPSKIYKIFSAANNICLWGIGETTKHLMRMSIEFFGVDDKRAVETEDKLNPEREAYTSDSFIGADAADNKVVVDELKGYSTDVTDANSELEVPREEFQ